MSKKCKNEEMNPYRHKREFVKTKYANLNARMKDQTNKDIEYCYKINKKQSM